MVFVERKPIDFKKERPTLLEMKGISAKTVEEHLKIYEGYVKKFNEISQKLESLTEEDYSSANVTYSTLRELKVEWTRAFGGMINHEIYFGHLGGNGGKPGSELGSQIDKDFGSFEKLVKEIKSTAMAARGWAWLLWSEDLNRLVVSISDEQNTFVVQNSKLLLGLDVFEHAYYLDYGSNRKGYVDIFFDNVDWPVVERKFSKLRL
ncbi:superoxide dismutase [Fe] [Nanobdella aerobiophila]|uniref:superoxide dismutase n=1 Tax=Nanobdella aerobiophila TaxID=2586965 RepID=A0A915SZK9_9ARCH|nr:superoxide dismutase [Nanobdella aerobiophila]BBL45319.1 superoxide dismutase [Fe] [Nanobdella aerobiophila]